ncbi:MAG: carboxypeptidase-like regulatory domain-containing protein [Thermoanaerobaculia bacterium]
MLLGVIRDMSFARAAVITVLLTPSLSAASLHAVGQGIDLRSCDGQITARRRCADAECETRSDSVARLSTQAGLTYQGGQWEIALAGSSRCWAPAIAIGGDTDGVLHVWPAAEINGTFGDAAPAEPLRAEFLLRADPTLVSSKCDVTGLRWRCAAPATSSQLRLVLDQRTPHYVPRLSLTTGERKDLGAIQFHRGASIAGVVALRGRHVDAEVEMTPTGDSAAGPARRLVLKEASDGLFQFAGVPPGHYRLAVRRPGWQMAEVKAFRVNENRESFLSTPIELKKAALIDLLITPPLAPGGPPWHVKLERAAVGGAQTPVSETEATVGGEWRNDMLPAGNYIVSVIDLQGSVFLQQRIDAMPDDEPRFLSVAKIQLRGVVRVGRQPFESRVIFTDMDGSKIAFRADAKGHFEGILPHEGRWQVQVRNPQETFYVKDSSVDVKRTSQEAVADVAIALPGGRAKGRVTNESGDPIDADVIVFREGKGIADAGAYLPHGRFELSGLEPGPVTLQAVSRSGESDAVSYLAAEESPASAELVLRKIVNVKTRVISEDGQPVAGAMVRYTAATMPRSRQAVSGPLGDIDLRLTGDTRRVFAAVAAVGFPSTIAMLDAQEPVAAIVLKTKAALLHVVHQSNSRWALVTLDKQAFLPVTSLLPLTPSGLAGFVDDGVEISVAPGAYMFCDDVRPDSTCQRVMLAAGERLTVQPAGGAKK